MKRIKENIYDHFKGIVFNNNFTEDAVLYDGTMYEGPSVSELVEIFNSAKNKVYLHEKCSNIKFPLELDETLYDIIYIDKNGYHKSELDLNIFQLIVRLDSLKDHLTKGSLIIFKVEDRIAINKIENLGGN